jgi:hypothetical protein
LDSEKVDDLLRNVDAIPLLSSDLTENMSVRQALDKIGRGRETNAQLLRQG